MDSEEPDPLDTLLDGYAAQAEEELRAQQWRWVV
jgi:hypothetical protein